MHQKVPADRMKKKKPVLGPKGVHVSNLGVHTLEVHNYDCTPPLAEINLSFVTLCYTGNILF
jgi:hypothetical protein